MNVYKVHYENGTQELVLAKSEQEVCALCTGVNQLSNVVQDVRVLEPTVKAAAEPPSEAQQAEELLASVPTAVAGESQ